MHFSSLVLLFANSITAAFGAAVQPCGYEGQGNLRTRPACDAVVVDATGKYSKYTTVQAGVDALSTTQTGVQNLFIYPGVYKEQVYIPPRAANLTIQGWTQDATSYHGNTASITYNLALINTTSDDLTATVRAWSKNLKVKNVDIHNTYGHSKVGGQNLALSAYTTRQAYYGVGLYGYQDTLLSNTGAQFYSHCIVSGGVDFIFGQEATAWFEHTDIRTITGGAITASGRNDSANPSIYVISNSTVAGINSTVEAAAGATYLGRPWGMYARVVFQNTYLSDIINPAGWRIWSATSPNTEHVSFGEYQNYGPGSYPTEGPRASFSSQLAAPITREQVLGADYLNEWYIESSYLS